MKESNGSRISFLILVRNMESTILSSGYGLLSIQGKDHVPIVSTEHEFLAEGGMTQKRASPRSAKCLM